MTVEKRINRVRRGWKKIAQHKTIQRLADGFDRFATTIWLIVGSLINEYWLMSFFVGLVGMINLYIVAQKLVIAAADATNRDALLNALRLSNGGFSIISSSLNIQLAICVACIVYALILANSRKIWLLTIGVIGVIYYSCVLVYGTVNGHLSVSGWLGALYVLVAALAIAMTSYNTWEKSKAERLYSDLLAKTTLTIQSLSILSKEGAAVDGRDLA